MPQFCDGLFTECNPCVALTYITRGHCSRYLCPAFSHPQLHSNHSRGELRRIKMPAAQLLFTRFILAVLVQCWGGVRWQMGKFACPLPVMYRCTLYTVFASQGVIGHLERTLGEEFQLSFEPNTRITKKCDRRDFDRETIKDARRVWVSWKLLISGDFFWFFLHHGLWGS